MALFQRFEVLLLLFRTEVSCDAARVCPQRKQRPATQADPLQVEATFWKALFVGDLKDKKHVYYRICKEEKYGAVQSYMAQYRATIITGHFSCAFFYLKETDWN